MKSCVASALFFLRVYNLDLYRNQVLDRDQVLGHMIAFYEEIRSDDDPTADSEDLLTYFRNSAQ